MIIGDALGKIFNNLQVEITTDKGNKKTVDVMYGYGDQKELNKWVSIKNKNNSIKYPLIWYPISDYKEDKAGFKVAESGLIILTDGNINLLNDEKITETYTNILEPIWQKVKILLDRNNNFFPIAPSGGMVQDRYIIKDEPNFGVEHDQSIRLSQSSFKTNESKGKKSITIDIVDAKIIEMKFRINTKCI